MLTIKDLQSLQVNDTLYYNDGRNGHRNIKATVIEVFLTRKAFVVQFEDRHSETTISINDKSWTNFLSLVK